MNIRELNKPVDAALLTEEERFEVLRDLHTYLCNIQTGGALNDPVKQAELFTKFFPAFHALVLDGANLSLDPTF